LLRLEHGTGTRTAIFGPERATQSFELAKISALTPVRRLRARGGVAYLDRLRPYPVPAVAAPPRGARARRGRWRAVARFPPAFWEVFKIVTSFTVAHSITLSLAALGVISLPSRLVESAIATSVVLAALTTCFPSCTDGAGWSLSPSG